MKMDQLFKNNQFEQLTILELDKQIKGLYYGDLLSWVMSHAKEGDAWVTVQTHVNIVAVASLLNLSCIIIPEGNTVDQDAIDKANDANIPIFSTELNAYEIFMYYHKESKN